MSVFYVIDLKAGWPFFISAVDGCLSLWTTALAALFLPTIVLLISHQYSDVLYICLVAQMSIRCTPSYLTFPVDSPGREWVTAVHPLILYQPFFCLLFHSLHLSSLYLPGDWSGDWHYGGPLGGPSTSPWPPPPPPPLFHLFSLRPPSPYRTSAWIWRIAGTAPWPGAAAPKTPSTTLPPWIQMSAVCRRRSPTAPARRSRPSTMSRGCTTEVVWLTLFTTRLMSTPGKVGL